MEEIWKNVLGYEGLYRASNLGMIKSTGNKTHKGEHYIALKKDKDGYLSVRLFKDGKPKDYRVHRVIYEAFYGKIPDDMQVNHINEQKDDNRLDNLNLMDCKTNINWGTGIERRAKQQEKAVYQLSLDGEMIKKFDSVTKAAKELNLHHAAISKCCLNRPHHITHGGFKWKYAN